MVALRKLITIIWFMWVTLGSEQNKIEKLLKNNFNEKLVQATDGAVVKFMIPWCGYCKSTMIPWCGYCKSMKAPFEHAASAVSSMGRNVMFGEVDCAAERELCDTNGITAFPTMVIYRVGGGNDKTKLVGYRNGDTFLTEVKRELGFE
ncbi:putative protein disulfide-isomerase ER-60 [Zancudomyces culisetae]|uniref:Thioredoxin domain-containing protein n=1 Tax=Zancudomyces culisetae TaxID=1213189 RepID=A0A1R1PJF2_ZANCU|nr:putative protein disulfide-isomerase ER-60 [Zancudomyces culisetae]|eukprot:OMH81105.1 putative protein disulfide-isomerase ER-60 [Zancudomyces culisetae]